MAEFNLTQSEAEALIAMEKKRVEDKVVFFSGPEEGKLSIPLTSLDRRENFVLDATRYQIKLANIDGPPHRNPDGEEIPCPHLHVYREGYADKWAHAVSSGSYPNTQDLFSTFLAFMKQCNIVDPPRVEKGLFS